MSSPSWYESFSVSLGDYLTKNPKINSLSGEQFLRSYLLENHVPGYMEDDEDQIIDDHIDSIQTYVNEKGLVEILGDSFRWARRGVNSKYDEKTILSTFKCDHTFLNKLLKKTGGFEIEEIEKAKQEILIENCDYPELEALSYKLAKEISRQDNYTRDEKSQAWFYAFEKSSSTTKSVECLEHSSDFKADQYKFEEAAEYLEKAIYILEPSLNNDREVNYLFKLYDGVKRRIDITFKRKIEKTHSKVLGLIRKCRIFYEQSGNRSKSSLLFVLEVDIEKRSKNILSQIFLFFYWMLAEYGESPVRVLGSCFLIVIVWAWIYNSMGISYNLSDKMGKEKEFITNIYFSIVTFTTLGYGDFSPPVAARIVASAQALLGLFMTSLFLVTFVRRYSR